MIEHTFITFSDSLWLYEKMNPPGVFFKLFSDSLNRKRLSSDLAIFTLDKVFEVSVFRAIVYPFFGLVGLLYEKGTERVLF
jgi:hypothetical protein